VTMIVNEGKVFRPHVLKEVRDPVNGDLIREIEPELLRVSPIRRETFAIVQQAMRGVVTEGTAEVVLTTEAVEVAGKTGTGEAGFEDRWHSWFAAYAPYQTDDPDERVVVVVMVEAENEWEWWAPKAANVIFQGIFANQTYEEAVETIRPWWYIQQQQAERAALLDSAGTSLSQAGSTAVSPGGDLRTGSAGTSLAQETP
jgi:penicillin-binding protein 2